MEEKIFVDIFGGCTIRDPFEMCKDLKNKYQVNVFIQNNPPATLGYDKLSSTTGISFSIDDFKNTNPCWFNWFELNAGHLEKWLFLFLMYV